MDKRKSSVDAVIKRGETAEKLLGNGDFIEFLEWLTYKRNNYYKAKKNANRIEKVEKTVAPDGSITRTYKPLTPQEELLFIRGTESYIEALEAVIGLAERNQEVGRKFREEKRRREDKEAPSSSSNS